MEQPEKKFAQYIYFDAPKEGRPDWVKGKMSLKRDAAIEYLKSLPTSPKGYVYFDLLVSKDGKKQYFQFDDYQKPDTQETSEISPEDPNAVPF